MADGGFLSDDQFFGAREKPRGGGLLSDDEFFGSGAAQASPEPNPAGPRFHPLTSILGGDINSLGVQGAPMLPKPERVTHPVDDEHRPSLEESLRGMSVDGSGMMPPPMTGAPTAQPAPQPAPQPADDLAQFYGSTTMGQRFLNPLQAGVEQFGQSRAGMTADLAARSLRDLEAMRTGKTGGATAAQIQAMSPEEYEQLRQARLAPLDEATREIVQRQLAIEAIPMNPATRGTVGADSFGAALEQFWRDPLAVIRDIGLQSLPASAPGMVAGTVGAAAGGPVVGASLMGLGSAGTEYVNAILDGLRENKIDARDPEALRAAFSDPELMARVRERAAVRGGIIGTFDALTFGAASKVLAPRALTSPLAREAANIPAQMGVQMAGGAGGEATAQLATEGRISQPGQVLAEAVGEMVTAPADVGGMALAGARSKSAGPSVISDAEFFGGATPEPSSAAPADETINVPPGGFARPKATDVVVTPQGRRLDVGYEVVEAADLVASNNADLSVNPAYPPELQPRDRTRAASGEQIADMAGNLTPELLGRSSSASEGAPIIGPDSVVESGNARVLALRRAYDWKMPGAEAYRRYLSDQGFDVAGFKQPVLVRRRVGQLSPEDRAAFTREANQRTTATMSASEQAQADSKALPDNLLDLYRGGDLTAAGNRDFVRGFLDGVVPVSERGSLYSREGGLSQEGQRRVENALFHRAYEDARLLASLREDPENSFRAIGGAMTDVAPLWAKMRADAARGTIPQALDVTEALREAVATVRLARTGKGTVADIAAQTDMLTGGLSPEGRAILGLMFRDDQFKKPTSRDRLTGSLRYYAEQARKASAAPGLFGGSQKPVSAVELLALARNRGEGGLFDTMPPTQAAESRNPFDQFDVMGDDEFFGMAAGRRNAAAGVNYTGFVQDTVAGTARTEPIRREDVLRPLMKALGLPLYQGRMESITKGHRVLGFYRPFLEEIRIKKMNDIETTAHEIAHALDDRIPEIRAQWFPASNANAAIRDELRGVSYDAKKLYEGFAEFVRLWATQKNQAQAKAPQFYQWFEGFVGRSKEYGPALRKAQEDMHAWFDQDAVTRARSKIGKATAINEGLSSIFDKLRQSIFDDLHGILRAEKTLKGDIPAVGSYETARLTRGKFAIVEGALLYGAPVVNADGSHSFKGKSLSAILDPVSPQLDDFLMYAVGRSARELMSQGREKLFTKAEVDGMVALERPEFRKAFDEYQTWNAAILDFAEAKGAINPNSRRAWKRAEYLPFHRVGQPGNFSKVPGDWKGIKALTGGSDNLRDILGNMVGNARTLIDAALTNEARLKVANMTGLKGSARFLVKIPSESRWVQIHRAEVERQILFALGVTDKKFLPVDVQVIVDQIIDGMEMFVPFEMKGQAPAGNNVVATLRDGKPEYYEVADPVLYRSLMALNRPSQHWLVQALSWPKRIGQMSITLTADFMAANIARDTLMGSIMSKHGFRPIVDSAKGMMSRLRTDDAYKDFVANGGGFASYLMDETAYRRHLDRFYARKGIGPRSVMDTPAKLLLGLERVADSFELSTRLGEFKQAQARGVHPRHAAYSAREVSTDFAMRGDSAALGFFYDTIIFLKAAANGTDRLYRGFVYDDNKAAIAIKTGLLAGASVGLYALNRGNPLYDDLEDFDKDLHWHFFIPTTDAIKAWHEGRELPPLEKRYHHLRYPRIWELGAMASIAERAFAGFLDNQPAEAAKASLKVIRDLFRIEYIPQAIAPLAEQAMNRNRFQDRPIETEAMQSLEPWARSGPFTSPTAKKIGEATRDLPPEMQISPARLEALLRGYLNTWAVYGLGLSDAALVDDKPEARIDDYPVIKKFYRAEPMRGNRYEAKLYDAIEAATMARRTMREMDQSMRPELADEMEGRPANLEYNQLQRADKHMRALRSENEIIYQAKSLPILRDIAETRAAVPGFEDIVRRAKESGAWNDIPKLKRLLVDDLTRERNTYTKDVMQDIDGQRKERKAMEAAR